MRVLFDVYWWVRGPVANRAIVRDLVATWIALFPADDIVLAGRSADRSALEQDFSDGAVQIESLRLAPHGIAVIVELPLVARRARVDVSVTHNFSPLFGRSAVFIQDVLFIEHPSWFTRRERLYFSLMPLSAPRAQVVLASSHTEGESLRRLVPKARAVRSVGLGLSRELMSSEPAPPKTALTAGSFFLTVGRLNIRKNLAFTCLAAVRSGRLSVANPLVVVGIPHGRSTEFAPEVAPAIDDGRILLLGHVDEGQLAWLYSHCAAFLFMTLGEGFGLPPLEALAFGARVIASDIPVMREVLDGHATFVDPTAIDALTQAIAAIPEGATSAELRQERSEWARSTNDWQRTVHAIRAGIEAAS